MTTRKATRRLPEKEVKDNVVSYSETMIERGQTAGMETKLDVFYAADKITEAEYTELTALLHPEKAEV